MSNYAENVAVVGTGYWGKNLVRNFSELGVLHALCDNDQKVLDNIQNQYQVPKTYTNYQEILDNPDIAAVVLATPAVTHYQLIKQAIESGKDVFVEKPMALNITEALDLAEIVNSHQQILMIDHLLQYHPAVNKLKEIINNGMLGKIQYIYSNRLNIGKLRQEENILWSFAPHDVSVILSLLGKSPTTVKAFGEAYLNDKIYDTTITYLDFPNRLKAHIFVSWLHPFKEQKLVVIGNHGMAVFDDTSKDEKLTFYPHKIEWINQIPVAAKADKEVIPIDAKEPLREACLHFLECVKTRKQPLTNVNESIEVLRVLCSAQDALQKGA